MELLVKVWEGIRKFLDVPKESTGSFFRHMRVTLAQKLMTCLSRVKFFLAVSSVILERESNSFELVPSAFET